MKKNPMRGTGGRNPPDDPEQKKRFVEKAKELEADETGREFEDVFDAIVPPAIPKEKESSRDS